jgi:hypothetical protein
MAFPYSVHKTYVTGEILTASDLNSTDVNHVNNNIPENADDYSVNVAEMQSTADPYPASVESLATTLAGEVERLRYQVKEILGEAQWYIDPDLTIAGITTKFGDVASYRRPLLNYVSATAVDVENNTGTANQTKYIFPDGNVRSVTEDTSSTHLYRRFIITATASLTATHDSGMRSGESEAVNTWYALYAVKTTDDDTKVVLVGSTTLPLQANFSTLNGFFGANGWIYLGLIRNGDNSGTTGDILSFTHTGTTTFFRNSCAINASGYGSGVGIRLATTTGANNLAWTYAAGTGAAQVPANITTGHMIATGGTRTAAVYGVTEQATPSYGVALFSGAAIPVRQSFYSNILEGFNVQDWAAVTSNSHDILMAGFVDNILGTGINPLI